ncbi:hypothetical protein BOX15_Mlig018137g1, partial [Macrostomum lignano]
QMAACESAAPPFSPLTLFESTITNAQMLLESMAERELFTAMRIVACLHSQMLQVMEPRFGRLCDRSDQLGLLIDSDPSAAGRSSGQQQQQQQPGQTSNQQQQQLQGSQQHRTKADPDAGDGVLGAALCAIKADPDDSTRRSLRPLADSTAAVAAGATPEDADDEEELEEELEEEDEECVIMAATAAEEAEFAASTAYGGYHHSQHPQLHHPQQQQPVPKIARYDFSLGASSSASSLAAIGGDVPAECKTVMRRAYKALKGAGPHLFDFSQPFGADVNQRVAAQVMTKAKELAIGKGWPDDIWQRIAYKYRIDGIFSHFRTKAKSKYREIKLSRRQRSFELVATSLSTDELEKFRVILTRDYTSSDEECGSGGSDQLRVRELPWESDEVKRLKRQLDQVYADNCATTKQRQQLAKSIRDPMRARSQRPPPEGAPDWALKPAPSSPTGASASGARR